jgi:3-vinyl bacteriochlorophyllide hydratase
MRSSVPSPAHPYGATTGEEPALKSALYTAEQRRRRDETVWTLVQGVLAPVQFVVFLVSLGLVIRFLLTGTGYGAATMSIMIKTFVLLTIMVTGAIWEKIVFGQYLLAPAFFWEDVVSFVVIALHLAYVTALLTHALTPVGEMTLALCAYAAYVLNAAQFVLKLRAARLQSAPSVASPSTPASSGSFGSMETAR